MWLISRSLAECNIQQTILLIVADSGIAAMCSQLYELEPKVPERGDTKNKAAKVISLIAKN